MKLVKQLPKSRDHWCGTPVAERLIALGNIFIEHKAVSEIIRQIKQELLHNAARNSSTGILVIGDPGSGKTTLIKHLQRLYPDVITPTLTTRPLVVFKVPGSPGPKSMGEALLKAIGDPDFARGNARNKLERIKILIKEVGVLIIILDDFQDVPARRGQRGVAQIGDWLRDICEAEDFPGVVVAFGIESAAIVRDSNPQLRRRMQARLELPVFRLDKDDERASFKQLLKLIDEALPLGKSSRLDTADNVARIHRATNGNLDYIMKLLGKALVRAVERGSECIETIDLLAGFQDQHQVAARNGNPFTAGYSGAMLDQPGQIFHRLALEDGHDPGAGERSKKSRE